jgi:hypothetical protein
VGKGAARPSPHSPGSAYPHARRGRCRFVDEQPDDQARTSQHAAGFVARGLIYGTIGILAVKLAVGAGGKATSQQGALKTIAQQPFGKVLLILVAIGLAGYALWRILRALLGHGPEASDSGFERVAALSKLRSTTTPTRQSDWTERSQRSPTPPMDLSCSVSSPPVSSPSRCTHSATPATGESERVGP